MSVVTEAATRWRAGVAFCRASAARARAFAAEDEGVRADFAASPRAADALDDAARDAVLRLDAGRGSGAAGSAEADFDLDDFDPADFDPVGFAAPGFAVADFAGSAGCSGWDAGVEPALRAEPDRDDVDVVEARGDRARGARSAVPRAGAGAATSPRSADTPVPVPSGVSSSGPERETEVTPTTYQPARAARWRTPRSARRDPARHRRPGRAAWTETVHRITIGLRLAARLGIRTAAPVSCVSA
ncbi:MAG TPA: hypothetical protein VFS72_03195 [Agromyces sp.]|nr:hypothetical protein [Agromyces sp.]